MSEENGQAATLNRVMATLSDVRETVLRQRFAQSHGIQYGGKRDLYAVGGYPKALEFTHFEDLYERDPIAGQIVDMVAETTWRNAPVIEIEDRPGGTAFTEAATELAKRLRLWSRMERLDKQARLGRYGVLLVGTAGTTDELFREPIRPVRGSDDILFVQPFSERWAKIDTWVEDPTDPRYGMPETYRIDLSSGVDGFRGGSFGSQIVHHSHCIHVAEGLDSDEVYGRPALKRIYNDMMDLQKISTSTAEAFWQQVIGPLIMKIDPGTDAKPNVVDDEELPKLLEALEEMHHDLRRVMVTQGGDVDRLASPTPDPSEAAELYMTKIAAGAGVPKRMLFGSETGERASTEDQKTYLGSISERQTSHAEPEILRPFLDLMIEIRALPVPGQAGYIVNWPELFQVPEAEVAEANLSRARTANELTPMGGDPMELIEIDKDRNVWLIPRDAEKASPFELPEVPPMDGGPAGEEPEEENGDE